jgi:FixJ family two-component response regulator
MCTRVLVVEDDPSMRRAIERLLNAAGYESVTFESSEALLRSEVTEAEGCVVSDVQLPGMSGLQLLDELQRQGRGHLPVILVTAFDTPGLRADALQRGAAAFLTKPFQGTALLEAIRDHVTLPGASSCEP